jgi:hypothetical protein
MLGNFIANVSLPNWGVREFHLPACGGMGVRPTGWAQPTPLHVILKSAEPRPWPSSRMNQPLKFCGFQIVINITWRFASQDRILILTVIDAIIFHPNLLLSGYPGGFWNVQPFRWRHFESRAANLSDDKYSCIRKVRSSILEQVPDYHDWGFSWLPSPSIGKCNNILKQVTTDSFRIHIYAPLLHISQRYIRITPEVEISLLNKKRTTWEP